MKLGIIIPDRGDRPKFVENCLRMIFAQTYKPFMDGSTVNIKRIGYPPKNEHVDITPRYRKGYEGFCDKGLDLIAFIENDDWYAPNYLETMVAAWERAHRPDIFGTSYTIYYHMELKAYFTMEHHDRASAMNTFIKPNLNIAWPVDLEPFLDMHLWRTIRNKLVFKPEQIISVGMKHGIGKTIGGGNHIVDDRVRRRYVNPNVNQDYPEGFLKTVLDAESFEFYNNYFK